MASSATAPRPATRKTAVWQAAIRAQAVSAAIVWINAILCAVMAFATLVKTVQSVLMIVSAAQAVEQPATPALKGNVTVSVIPLKTEPIALIVGQTTAVVTVFARAKKTASIVLLTVR